ncbi:hypothetical protein BDV24DRAFT_130562 [Aspergillus arachidicola]|uniref:Uncharacterized protein n=1 Tax=Aspergillus arachidicola TaxID=656916 RepID=A0A5N6YDN3_9EURO|nr:hypothetical protein BDV24DRAFT_130562 [Aspergillus arachidicola]
MRSPPLDSNVRRDKRTCYRGRAKIFLENLEYRGTSSRGNVDDKHVDHLIHVFRTEGCMRLHDPEHYVPALITPDDLTNAAKFSRLRLIDLTQDGEPHILSLPSNLKIRILHGEHWLRAAERFLEPNERWWVVVLYTTRMMFPPGPCKLPITADRSWRINPRCHSGRIFTSVEIYRWRYLSEYTVTCESLRQFSLLHLLHLLFLSHHLLHHNHHHHHLLIVSSLGSSTFCPRRSSNTFSSLCSLVLLPRGSINGWSSLALTPSSSSPFAFQPRGSSKLVVLVWLYKPKCWDLRERKGKRSPYFSS